MRGSYYHTGTHLHPVGLQRLHPTYRVALLPDRPANQDYAARGENARHRGSRNQADCLVARGERVLARGRGQRTVPLQRPPTGRTGEGGTRQLHPAVAHTGARHQRPLPAQRRPHRLRVVGHRGSRTTGHLEQLALPRRALYAQPAGTGQSGQSGPVVQQPAILRRLDLLLQSGHLRRPAGYPAAGYRPRNVQLYHRGNGHRVAARSRIQRKPGGPEVESGVGRHLPRGYPHRAERLVQMGTDREVDYLPHTLVYPHDCHLQRDRSPLDAHHRQETRHRHPAKPGSR